MEAPADKAERVQVLLFLLLKPRHPSSCSACRGGPVPSPAFILGLRTDFPGPNSEHMFEPTNKCLRPILFSLLISPGGGGERHIVET